MAALLERGKPESALDALECASLTDLKNLEVLRGLELRNQSAKFVSPMTVQLRFEMAGDAELRFRIGEALLSKLRASADFTDAD